MIIVSVMKGEDIVNFEFVEVPRKGDLVACGFPIEGPVKSVIWKPQEAPIIVLED